MNHVFDWDYKPIRGAFQVRVMSDAGTYMIHESFVPTLDEAAEVFARHALPMRMRVGAAINDEADIILLRYMCRYDPMEAGWWGTAAGFTALGRCRSLNPVDLAIWEQMAKDAMGVPT
jgi:hypothetical protein